MRLKSAHSALVVLAVLLTHGMAYGQKDEVSHGPATNTTGRNATMTGYWEACSSYDECSSTTCHHDDYCHWNACSSDGNTCTGNEVEVEYSSAGCLFGLFGGDQDRCCARADLCWCGE